MKDSIIKSIKATQVVVPARPGSLNSENVLDKDRGFAKRFLTGESWTEFANQPKWIIEIELNNGLIGIGETYRSADEKNIAEAINTLAGKDLLQLNWRRLPIEDQRTYEGFECALLDLAGQLLQVPIHQLLGGAYRSEVECLGWTGRRTPEDAADKAFEAMQKGHKVFKFKCSDEDPVRLWTEAIRRKCGDGIKIILDPNQRWTTVEKTLELMDGVDPEIMFGLEDPILHEDVDGFKKLRAVLKMPLYRHISLPYTQDIRDIIKFIKAEAVDGYNFNGSAYNSVLLAEIAHLEGKSCWRGSEVDLGISEAIALHIAAASINCTLPADLFGELVREDDLIEAPLIIQNGKMQVPSAPGLGVKLDREAMKKFQTGTVLTGNTNE